MYYPVQIPYILNDAFSRHMKYMETPVSQCHGFVLCFWEMLPLTNHKQSIRNIIAADACIDLVVGFDEKSIGFSGKRKTDFNFKVELPARYMGARLMPGAFKQLTGRPAAEAMDNFLPVTEVFADFDQDDFFRIPFKDSREYIKIFLTKKIGDQKPDQFTTLFHLLSEDAPATTKALYELLHFSPRQCQRLFLKHYGVTPKMALSIVRFQKCLAILTAPNASPADILSVTTYYDQPHLINDFKRNIGLTPMELLRFYQK